MSFILFPDRSAERYLGRCAFHHVANFCFRHSQPKGNLVDTRTMTQLLRQLRNFGFKSIQFVLQLRGKLEHLPIVSNRSEDRLANPPARIRNESNAPSRIETRSGFDEAHLCFIASVVERI